MILFYLKSFEKKGGIDLLILKIQRERERERERESIFYFVIFCGIFLEPVFLLGRSP
jgi:hypothetical protein